MNGSRMFSSTAVLMFLGACTIKSVDTGNEIGTTSHTAGVGGDAESGSGGAGGAEENGGASSNSSAVVSSSASNTSSSSGAGGAEPTCVGETGTGKTVASCDSLNIAPKFKKCGANYDESGIGYQVCQWSFGGFLAGAAEYLENCLSKIGVEDACESNPVQDCVNKMYKNVCHYDDIVAACNDIKTACGNDSFNADNCATQLMPFSDKSINSLNECLSEAGDKACQTAFDECFGKVWPF